MKPEAPPSPSTPTTPRAPSLQPTAPPEPTKAPRRGNRGKAAKYGPLDRAAESWTDRELTECLRRFIDLIISALGSGRAYLADAKGKPPEGWAAACGWTWYQSGIDRGCWEIDNHNSVRIGWLDDGRVYLDANEAARLTQAFAAQQNKPLSNPDTVVARLAEKGWLAVEHAGENAVQDAEDPGGCPPAQPPGLRRPGLLAAGRPGARLATRPTPTGKPKDPPRRRVTASLAHQNHGSGPGWRTTVRRVSQPPEAAKPVSGALAHASHQYTRPYTQNAPRRETSPTRKRQPPRATTRRLLFGNGVPSRQKATLQPSEAASRGALGLPECATGAPERPGSAPRRLAEVRAFPNPRPNQHQHRHERQAQGEEPQRVVPAHLAH